MIEMPTFSSCNVELQSYENAYSSAYLHYMTAGCHCKCRLRTDAIATAIYLQSQLIADHKKCPEASEQPFLSVAMPIDVNVEMHAFAISIYFCIFGRKTPCRVVCSNDFWFANCWRQNLRSICRTSLQIGGKKKTSNTRAKTTGNAKINVMRLIGLVRVGRRAHGQATCSVCWMLKSASEGVPRPFCRSTRSQTTTHHRFHSINRNTICVPFTTHTSKCQCRWCDMNGIWWHKSVSK